MSRFFTACCFLLALSSCANRKVGKKVTLDPVTVTSTGKGLDLYRATPSMVWDITHTRVAISFNLAERIADGQAWINLHPYIYPTDTLVLDAKSMMIQSVQMDGTGGKTLPFDYRDNKLKIKLGKEYRAQDTIQVYVKYRAMPYGTEVGGSKAIAEDRGLYFINTDHSVPNKPVQIWTQGETEATSHWMPTFDKPNERFTTQVEITVPDSFKTLGNGYLLSQVRSGAGLRTDTWIMEKQMQPYVAMMAIGNYAVVEDKWRGREVSYYVEPEFKRYARLMFKNTPEMMEYFSTITGVAYPWNKYSQVVVRDYVSGAMENTTATVFGEFMNQNAREIADKDYEDIVSHELFHQWFGDYVTAESWSNLTVNESFATYGEQLWRRHKYGDASADELAYDDLRKYLSSARQSEPALVRHRYANREEMFDLISYQKGGAILKYMHGLMGDSAFFKSMKVYLTQNALKPAEATHWRLAVEEATGQDWNWFFNQWYNKGGFPELEVEYNYDDAAQQLVVTVEQKQDSAAYTLPLKTELVYGADKTVVDWNVRDRRQRFTYPYKNGMRPVVIPDSRNWLVGKMADKKQTGQFKTQFAQSKDNFLNRYRAVAGVSKQLSDKDAQEIYTFALSDKEPGIREQVLRYLARQTDKKLQDKWRREVALMALNDGAARVRAAAFDVLSAWKVESSKPDMLAALADSSYSVAGAALNGLYKLKDDTAYTLSKSILQGDPKARLLFTASEIVGEEGKAADVELYTRRAQYLYGTNKIEFAHAMATYMTNVRDLTAFEKALPVYVQMVNSESIGSYRFAIGSFFFEAAGNIKERSRDARTNAEKEEAEQKLSVMKKYAEQIVNNEKEKNYQRQYKNAMKVLGS